MKARQIKKLLSGVKGKFMESIGDENIRDIIKEYSFISGGCIPSMLMDEYVNDFDFYFITEQSANKVREYYKNCDVKEKYSVKLITDNAVNLTNKIQLVTKFYGLPNRVVEKFDWAHIKSYFWFNKDNRHEELVIDDSVYRIINEKELIYTGSDYPLSSLLRVRKYIKKGWYVSTSTMTHIVLDAVKTFNQKQLKRTKKNQIIKTNEIEDDNFCDKFYVDDIIQQLNGVDPLTIQRRLLEQTNTYLTIKEIINIING